tara:strand:- start:4188 stop:4847 length:660 start_codon:yes stop_codon:yes gene_type:complete
MRRYIRIKYGFTLIELLIAIFIFAIISIIALSAFMSAERSKGQVIKAIDSLTNVQKSYVIMKRDIAQIINRSVLSENGKNEIAVASGGSHKLAKSSWGSNILEITRMGNIPLATDQKVSNLVRIAYYFDGKKLRRISFRELDHTKNSIIDSNEIMSDISNFTVKFVDVFGSEVSSWFMESSAKNSSYNNSIRQITIRFRTKSLGEIEWVFALPVINNKS